MTVFGFKEVDGHIEMYKRPDGGYVITVIRDGNKYINSFNATAPISFVFDDLINGVGKLK
jgi:hypothetical protein